MNMALQPDRDVRTPKSAEDERPAPVEDIRF
jgi:hypothetical protein